MSCKYKEPPKTKQDVLDQLEEQGRQDQDKGRDYNHNLIMFAHDEYAVPLKDCNRAYDKGWYTRKCGHCGERFPHTQCRIRTPVFGWCCELCEAKGEAHDVESSDPDSED